MDKTGRRPPPLEHLYLGPGFEDAEIENQLRQCGSRPTAGPTISPMRPPSCSRAGKVVGWFQGRMEGGPRALGGRSILADPRTVAARDRVNAAIKFREYWRPFCPSLTVEADERFLNKPAPAPFMILAFEATDEAEHGGARGGPRRRHDARADGRCGDQPALSRDAAARSRSGPACRSCSTHRST